MKTEQHGFTIVEMMITVTIVSIIFVLASSFVIDGLNTQRFVSQQNDAIVEARKALKVITSELREAVAADTGAYPLELIDEQEIIFFSDIDSDDFTERVHYFLDGTLLQRGIVEPTGDPLTYQPASEVITTLASYVVNDTAPLFTYFNEDYPDDQVTNPLSAPIDQTEVRMIGVFVSTNVDPTRVPETHDLSLFIQLRNLKENF